ncbi:hypothetical protein FRB99_006544 [Tulasnella sp. 403]|nr:hypothetical protein FRB99_006544 [Tulasnella sp. 403]
MSKPVGVAILGAGIFAREAHLPAIAVLAEATKLRLQAVWSRSQASASNLGRLASETLELPSTFTVYSDESGEGLDDLLSRSDVDAVIVVLPIPQQPEIIIKALKAGKHVLSEKPVAKDVQVGLKLIETYESEYKHKGPIWRVAENFECEPGILAAAAAIRAGRIGKVAYFRLTDVGTMGQDSKWYQTSWRTIPDYQGGFLLDGGVHHSALLRTVLPSDIVALSGVASLTKEYLAPEDTIQSVLQLADGSHGILELSYAAPVEEKAVTITGTEGHIRITTEKRLTPSGEEAPHYAIKIVNKADQVDTQYYRTQGVEKEIDYFVQAINGAHSSESAGKGEPRGALRDVAVIEASLKSKGQLMDIKKLVGES